jgi:uncharacterized membrane protein
MVFGNCLNKFLVSLTTFIVSFLAFTLIHSLSVPAFWIMVISFFVTIYYFLGTPTGQRLKERDRREQMELKERRARMQDIREEEYNKTRARLKAEREHKQRWGDRGAVP